MAIRPHSLQLHDTNIQSEISTIKPKQILFDSTNTNLANPQTSSVVDNSSIQLNRQRRRRRVLLTVATIRRNKAANKRKNQLESNRVADNKLSVDIDTLMDIQRFQEKKPPSLKQDKELQMQQRAMYNARQTPLIPLIADLDFSMLSESSQQQQQSNDLLFDILALLKNVNEECSFFEQFQIETN